MGYKRTKLPLDIGTPWLEIDTIDPKATLNNGDTVADVVLLMMRTEQDAREKIRELRLQEQPFKP